MGEATHPGPRWNLNGKGSGKPDYIFRITTANVTTWAAHAEAVADLGREIVAIQEHRIPEHKQREARAAARRWGYNAHFGEAPTRGGDRTIHAGVAVLVKQGLPSMEIGRGRGPHEGRWIAVRIGGGLGGGGITVVSLYATVGIGAQGENIELLKDGGQFLEHTGGHWIIAGGFNMTPQEVACTGWIRKLSADVISRSGAGLDCEGRDIDYFVASRGWNSRID